jgi:hypothetical protein
MNQIETYLRDAKTYAFPREDLELLKKEYENIKSKLTKYTRELRQIELI